MKNRPFSRLIALMVLMSAIIPLGYAQHINDNAIFYHSFRSPWATELNPALFPTDSRYYIQASRVDFSLSLPLSYNELGLQYDPERDATILNVNDLLTRLKGNGCYFSTDADLSILGFGFTISDAFHFNFKTGVRTANSINIPLGVFDLLTEGNATPEAADHILEFGTTEILSSQTYAYASAGFALELPILNGISVGARVNVLDGIQAVTADNLSIQLNTNADISRMQLSSDFLVHSAGLIALNPSDTNMIDNLQNFDIKSISFPKNFGYTIDFGAKYTLGPCDFSFSITDLGPGIHWKQNPVILVPKQQEATLTFDGIDLSTLITDGEINTEFFNTYIDSLKSMIDYQVEEDDYWYSLPTNLYVGASASLGKLLRVGYLFQGQWVNGLWNNHQSGSNHFCCNNNLSAHLNLFNRLELSVSNAFTYDGHNTTWFNPGAAVTLGIAQRMQCYAAIQYMSNIRLTELKSAHIVFGVNWVGVNKKK